MNYINFLMCQGLDMPWKHHMTIFCMISTNIITIGIILCAVSLVLYKEEAITKE